MLAAGCDEAVHTDVTSDIKGFNNGTWDSYFLVENVWSKNYEGIRIVNRFLERIDDLKMPVKPTVSGTDEQLIRTRERMKGEAFFLRAYFYFELIKRYGGVPLFTKSLTVEEAQQATRASYDDCMKQIIADCDSAANRLPEQYKGSSESVGFDDKKELGRPTTGAAYGLKSRALLYWASPLNNPGNDKERYKRSADAAQLVVKSAFRYKLMNFTDDSESFTDLYAVSENFLQYHREIVFSTKYNNTVSVEQQNSPLTMGGKGLTNPTQNLADAFGMANGKGINEPGSGYDEDHPYVGRDPRFYMTFAYDGSEFTVNDKTQTIETFEGGKDATATNKTATKTGYYLKKLLSPQAVWDGRTNNARITDNLQDNQIRDKVLRDFCNRVLGSTIQLGIRSDRRGSLPHWRELRVEAGKECLIFYPNGGIPNGWFLGNNIRYIDTVDGTECNIYISSKNQNIMYDVEIKHL